MARSIRKWDGVLNPGGVIGGLGCGAIVCVIAFANAEPGSRWAAKATILAVIGGACAGTIAWKKCFSRFDPVVAAITGAHKQIVERGAECPRCQLHHTDYRLLDPGESLDQPCIICRSCGRSSAPSEFSGIHGLDQIAT